jgi:sterol desaturase/sphingolipid hydroxylase (fatty acid hydroxylase superfamily)
MNKQFVGLILGFVALTLIFWVIEFFWPSIPNQKRWGRRGFQVDLLFWFFTPLVTKSITRVAVLVAVVPLFLIMGRSLNKEAIAAGYGPMMNAPAWLQVVLILVVGDFIGYWTHRWFHTRRLWKFHAVHHSSKEVDWLSSVRLHPVNDVVTRVAQAVPFVLLGFSPLVIAAYVPFLTFYAILLHANVSWSFGPLKYLLASPTFHRWHHTREDEAIDMNFAGLLPIWDILFGTFYMPRGKRPTKFGVHDDSVPETFIGQLLYPFRRTSVRENRT